MFRGAPPELRSTPGGTGSWTYVSTYTLVPACARLGAPCLEGESRASRGRCVRQVRGPLPASSNARHSNVVVSHDGDSKAGPVSVRAKHRSMLRTTNRRSHVVWRKPLTAVARLRRLRAAGTLHAIAVVVLLLSFGGCGESTGPGKCSGVELSSRHDKLECEHLQSEQGSLERYESVLSAFREQLQDVRTGRVAVQPVSRTGALARLQRSRVILVGDLHDTNLCRIGFLRLLEDLDGQPSDEWERTELGLEAFPISWQPLVDGLLREDAELRGVGFRELLPYAWNWPVEELASIVERRRSRCNGVLALGGTWLCRHPRTGTPDRLRAPSPGPRISAREWALLYERTSEQAAWTIRTWLDVSPKRRVVVLFGVSHVVDPQHGIPAYLEAQGTKSVSIVLPYHPDLADVLAPCGEGDERTWHALPGDVLYPPYVTRADIVKEALSKAGPASDR